MPDGWALPSRIVPETPCSSALPRSLLLHPCRRVQTLIRGRVAEHTAACQRLRGSERNRATKQTRQGLFCMLPAKAAVSGSGFGPLRIRARLRALLGCHDLMPISGKLLVLSPSRHEGAEAMRRQGPRLQGQDGGFV